MPKAALPRRFLMNSTGEIAQHCDGLVRQRPIPGSGQPSPGKLFRATVLRIRPLCSPCW